MKSNQFRLKTPPRNTQDALFLKSPSFGALSVGLRIKRLSRILSEIHTYRTVG